MERSGRCRLKIVIMSLPEQSVPSTSPRAQYFRERNLQEEYTEREIKWLEVLSRHSKRETNLKALRKMNIKTDMLNHVRQNIYLLPLEKRVQFADFELGFESQSRLRWLPAAVLGFVGFWLTRAISCTALSRNQVPKVCYPIC